jgi:hypothetical protein
MWIWESENTHKFFAHERDNFMFTVFTVMSKEIFKVFFTESTVTGIVCLKIRQGLLIPQLQEHMPVLFNHQDGVQRHFHKEVGSHLDEICTNQEFRLGRPMEWPQR